MSDAGIVPRQMIPGEADLSAIVERIKALDTSPPTPLYTTFTETSDTTTSLSSLERMLLHILPASNAILSDLHPVQLVLLAASSRTLWSVVYSHPYLWRYFNLRIHTPISLKEHLDTRLPEVGAVTPRKLPGQILQKFSLSLKELQEYRLPITVREHDSTTYGFRANDAPGFPTPAGVAGLMLSRIQGEHAFPQWMVVENYWLANSTIVRQIGRFVQAKRLDTLEVNLLMERDIVEMYRRDFTHTRPGTLFRSFVLLRKFLEAANPVGLHRLVVTGAMRYLTPIDYVIKMFHKQIVQVLDLLTVIDWCRQYGVEFNIVLCSCSRSDAVDNVRAAFEAMSHNPQYPRPELFMFPTFGFREARVCDACGEVELMALCEECCERRRCGRCQKFRCDDCFDEYERQLDLTRNLWTHRDYVGDAGEDYDTEAPPHPNTARPYAHDRGGTESCTICAIPKAPNIERKVCGRCGRLVNEASIGWVAGNECHCGEILCASCTFVTEHNAVRECNVCWANDAIDDNGILGGCPGHGFVDCVGCERQVCPNCYRNGTSDEPGYGECLRCEQFFCASCRALCRCDEFMQDGTRDCDEKSMKECPVHRHSEYICSACNCGLDLYYANKRMFEQDSSYEFETRHKDVLAKGGNGDHESEAGSSEGSQWGMWEDDWVDDLEMFRESVHVNSGHNAWGRATG